MQMKRHEYKLESTLFITKDVDENTIENTWDRNFAHQICEYQDVKKSHMPTGLTSEMK